VPDGAVSIDTTRLTIAEVADRMASVIARSLEGA